MFDFISNWRRERESIRELSRLTDRELADLGIARADIRTVAAGATLTARDAAASQPAAALRAQGWAEAAAPSWGAHNRQSVAA